MSAAEVPIREAATVVLLRDGRDGLQTWMLRRVPKMAFAAGMSVFPGGAVDPQDAELASRLLAQDDVAVTVHSMAAQLDVDPATAGRLLCAALRETFEEVGVLLADPPAVIDAELRGAVEAHAIAFATVLADAGVALDVAAVRPWARWVTPAGESRRYDTYFFVAELPEGAAADAVTSEASHADWIGVAQALAEYEAGARPMLPPTISTLTDLAAHRSTAEVMAAAAERTIRAVRPSFVRDADGALAVDLGDGRRIELPPNFVGASGKPPVGD